MPPSQPIDVPNPENPWEGALTDAEEIRRAAVGKKVADVSSREAGTDQQIVVSFEDGTTLLVTSWDYEGYRSGIYLHRVP